MKPKLVFTMPVANCEDLVFDRRGVAKGHGVEEICLQKGMSSRPVFAVRGRTAARFVPFGFHEVHGELELAEGEEDTIYFYRYRERYRTIIHAP